MYMISLSEADNDGARQVCNAAGGKLLEVTSQQEQDNVEDILKSVIETYGSAGICSPRMGH